MTALRLLSVVSAEVCNATAQRHHKRSSCGGTSSLRCRAARLERFPTAMLTIVGLSASGNLGSGSRVGAVRVVEVRLRRFFERF